eukprot:TRINITY_DN13256_c1_g1_i1.p1 TRINITY_DN13256_c1_g1~~TRINITY_DN13256_c1_g1_i1.p1  ORF type:complete len:772 (+),score=73.80 TRINITY_DN13256_c1_g1_i1:31-2346(+)
MHKILSVDSFDIDGVEDLTKVLSILVRLIPQIIPPQFLCEELFLELADTIAAMMDLHDELYPDIDSIEYLVRKVLEKVQDICQVNHKPKYKKGKEGKEKGINGKDLCGPHIIPQILQYLVLFWTKTELLTLRALVNTLLDLILKSKSNQEVLFRDLQLDNYKSIYDDLLLEIGDFCIQSDIFEILYRMAKNKGLEAEFLSKVMNPDVRREFEKLLDKPVKQLDLSWELRQLVIRYNNCRISPFLLSIQISEIQINNSNLRIELASEKWVDISHTHLTIHVHIMEDGEEKDQFVQIDQIDIIYNKLRKVHVKEQDDYQKSVTLEMEQAPVILIQSGMKQTDSFQVQILMEEKQFKKFRMFVPEVFQIGKFINLATQGKKQQQYGKSVEYNRKQSLGISALKQLENPVSDNLDEVEKYQKVIDEGGFDEIYQQHSDLLRMLQQSKEESDVKNYLNFEQEVKNKQDLKVLNHCKLRNSSLNNQSGKSLLEQAAILNSQENQQNQIAVKTSLVQLRLSSQEMTQIENMRELDILLNDYKNGIYDRKNDNDDDKENKNNERCQKGERYDDIHNKNEIEEYIQIEEPLTVPANFKMSGGESEYAETMERVVKGQKVKQLNTSMLPQQSYFHTEPVPEITTYTRQKDVQARKKTALNFEENKEKTDQYINSTSQPSTIKTKAIGTELRTRRSTQQNTTKQIQQPTTQKLKEAKNEMTDVTKSKKKRGRPPKSKQNLQTKTRSLKTQVNHGKKVDNLGDRKSTRLNSSHQCASRMPSSA